MKQNPIDQLARYVIDSDVKWMVPPAEFAAWRTNWTSEMRQILSLSDNDQKKLHEKLLALAEKSTDFEAILGKAVSLRATWLLLNTIASIPAAKKKQGPGR